MLNNFVLVCVILAAAYGIVDAHEITQPETLFSGAFHAERDEYGRFIAAEVSAFYSSRSYACSGPVYQCRGIMVSAFETNSDYWMQSFPVLSKISLSYWTKNVTEKTRYDAAWLGTGFMLWPSEVIKKLSGGYIFEPEYTCVFATEALTGNDLHNGCGGYGEHSWPECQTLGINSLQQYTEHFGRTRLNACGFSLGKSLESDRRAFDNALALQLTENTIYGGTFYNEVLMKGWYENNPGKIPLLGFFYIKGHHRLQPHGYLDIVRRNQALYYKKTHVYVPVIRISGSDWEHVIFEYKISDQSGEIPKKVMVNADMSLK